MPAKSSSKSSQKKKPLVRTNPTTVICRFTVRPEREKDFVRFLCRDWPCLLRLGLATKDEPVVYRHVDETGGPVYFQIFHWTDADAPRRAHANPEVLASWTSMDPFLEERGGRAKCEFPHVEQVPMNWVGIRGLSGATGRP